LGKGLFGLQLKIIIFLLIALFGAIFALQNSAPVFINLFAWQFEIRMVIVILGSIALGALCIWIFSLIKQIGSRKKILDQQSQIKKLEEKIQQLQEEISSLEKNITGLEAEKLDLLTEINDLKSRLSQPVDGVS